MVFVRKPISSFKVIPFLGRAGNRQDFGMLGGKTGGVSFELLLRDGGGVTQQVQQLQLVGRADFLVGKQNR
ncbi:hypothetical protein D1872_283140 [compost metagenome]